MKLKETQNEKHRRIMRRVIRIRHKKSVIQKRETYKMGWAERIARLLIAIVFVPLIVVCLFVGFIMFTDYKPEDMTAIGVENNQAAAVKVGENLSVLTFNIGYCGMDQGQDFFVDGGTMSRSSSKKQTEQNMQDIILLLDKQKSDFLLFQEVDVDSWRSYGLNELGRLRRALSDCGSAFAVNYKVAWVPVPLANPMGYVNSGMVTFSKRSINNATRYKYPGEESWPTSLFEPDRCFVACRFLVDNGKELILINSYLSAFDKDGEIRKQQLSFLKKYISDEYAKGNYIIVGGDWNYVLPSTDPARFKTTQAWPFWLRSMPGDFAPDGFKWGVDASVPSVRTADVRYTEGINYQAVVDGFLVSPNVSIHSVNGCDASFKSSDHNAVRCVFSLNQVSP